MSLLDSLSALFNPLPSMNVLSISKSALLNNLVILRAHDSGTDVFPVVKSNAYGHGLKQVCTILKGQGLTYLCVDSFPEYQIVRDYAKTKVLVLGETVPELYKQYGSDATLCVGSVALIKALVDHNCTYTIHLFLNTGMNREGCTDEQLQTVFDLLRGSKIKVEGVLSHFANADEVDDGFSFKQMEQFSSMVDRCKQERSTMRYVHLNNSAGRAKYDQSLFAHTASRAGLALYGYSPLTSSDSGNASYRGLRPALTLRSTVTSVQTVTQGAGASYGMHCNAPSDGVVFTLPFGYTEGLTRAMSNNGLRVYDRQRNVWYQQVGTICMNLSLYFDPTGLIKWGDQIELLGVDSGSDTSIHDRARAGSTIPYEILVGLDRGVRRMIV